jgi:hypothetical protein
MSASTVADRRAALIAVLSLGMIALKVPFEAKMPAQNFNVSSTPSQCEVERLPPTI